MTFKRVKSLIVSQILLTFHRLRQREKERERETPRQKRLGGGGGKESIIHGEKVALTFPVWLTRWRIKPYRRIPSTPRRMLHQSRFCILWGFLKALEVMPKVFKLNSGEAVLDAWGLFSPVRSCNVGSTLASPQNILCSIPGYMWPKERSLFRDQWIFC